MLIPGLETIDVSALPRHHPAAHEYQYYNPYVVADLVELLRDGRGASDRGETVARNRDGIRYWVLEAEAKGAPR